MIAPSPFDSSHYDLDVGKASLASLQDVDVVLEELRASDYDVVFVRIDHTHVAVHDALAMRGHAPLETLVTSALGGQALHAARAAPAGVQIHELPVLADAADIDAVSAITLAAIHGTHLHKDARLPEHRTQRLYAAWARNDVTGRAQRTLLARVGRDVIGYLTILQHGSTAVIDLVAVHPDWHARGVGSAMLDTFVSWVRREGFGARVGTQSDNPALALYGRFGFEPVERHWTYHLWRP